MVKIQCVVLATPVVADLLQSQVSPRRLGYARIETLQQCIFKNYCAQFEANTTDAETRQRRAQLETLPQKVA